MSNKTIWIIGTLALLGTAVVAASGAMFSAATPASDRAVAKAVPPRIGGPFVLVDHNGRTVTDKTFGGKFMLIYFGYTYCPDVCPTDLQIIGEAMDMLGGDAGKVQPIFISVDPGRDTGAVLADYVGHFHPRLLGLTGTPAQVRRAAKGYRVVYRKFYPPPLVDNAEKEETAQEEDDNADYFFAHTALTYLIGPDGGLLRMFAHGTGPEAMARDIREHLNNGTRS